MSTNYYSGINNQPHEIHGELLISDEIAVKKMTCSCKAGNSGTCKHVGAVLIYCTRFDIERLQIFSQTDIKCLWNQKKECVLEKYKPMPLLQTDCSKKIGILDDNFSVNQLNFRKMLEKACPHSALVKHKSRRRAIIPSTSALESTAVSKLNDYTEIIINYSTQSIIMMKLQSMFLNYNLAKCCKKTLEDLFSSDVLEIADRTHNNKIEWHKERQYRITGSRCYDIFTYSKKEWESKAMRYFWPKKFSSKYVQHGVSTENIARKKYETINGVQVVETGLIVSHHNPWIGFSPDGLIFEKNIPIKLLEIKCPFYGKIFSIQFYYCSLIAYL